MEDGGAISRRVSLVGDVSGYLRMQKSLERKKRASRKSSRKSMKKEENHRLISRSGRQSVLAISEASSTCEDEV